MRVVKNEKGFPAVLKDTQGRLLSEGYGSVLEEYGEVEFRGDFVPLYRMGVPLKLIRRAEGQDIHIFIGEVYISDSKLLRLMHVRDLLLPGSEKIYSTKVDIPGHFVLSEVQEYLEAHPPRFSIFHRRKPQEEPTPAPEYPMVLTALSGKQLEFSSEYLLETGDDIRITFTPELDVYFDDVPAVIDKVYAFGEGVAYFATLQEMPTWQRERLDNYLRQLNEKENRFFPQMPEIQPEEIPRDEPDETPEGEGKSESAETESKPGSRLDIEI